MSTKKEGGRNYLHPQVRTAGGRLVPGEPYALRLTGRSVQVILLRDRSTDDELKFRLEVVTPAGLLSAGKRLTVSAPWEGGSEWQLFDAAFSEKEKSD